MRGRPTGRYPALSNPVVLVEALSSAKVVPVSSLCPRFALSERCDARRRTRIEFHGLTPEGPVSARSSGEPYEADRQTC